MTDLVFVEGVGGELVLAAVECELVSRHEIPQEALAPAMRAIARHCVARRISCNGEGDGAAVATSAIGHVCCPL
jgi:hypothetical protein